MCARFHCRALASIVTPDAPRPIQDVLRKDYAFLFERFFYFLEDRGPAVQGIVVFDELEKSQANILIEQIKQYFLNTARGRERSRQIIPAPFFVHSDLTTLIQVADLLAYVISWGVRVGTMHAPAREELEGFATRVLGLRYRTTREIHRRAMHAETVLTIVEKKLDKAHTRIDWQARRHRKFFLAHFWLEGDGEAREGED